MKRYSLTGHEEPFGDGDEALRDCQGYMQRMYNLTWVPCIVEARLEKF